MQGGEFIIQNTLQWPSDSSSPTCVTGTSISTTQHTIATSSCGASEASIGYGKEIFAGSIAGSVIGGFMLGVLTMLAFNMRQKSKTVQTEHTNSNDDYDDIDGGRLGSQT